LNVSPGKTGSSTGDVEERQFFGIVENTQMTDAVIVSTARTPLCKSWRGALNMTHGATMGGHVVKQALERAKLDPVEVEDVIMGCATPEGATGGNIARQIALRAGMPVSVSGMTVNRFCSSGLQTVALAAQRVLVGEADIFVAGGVESISCVQNEANKHMYQEDWLTANKPEIYWTMLATAENVAKRYKISREVQDRYGVDSQLRAGEIADGGEVQGRDRTDLHEDENRGQEYWRRDAQRCHGNRRRGHPS
jgi:acetyl-CoA C-acetyltransferase